VPLPRDNAVPSAAWDREWSIYRRAVGLDAAERERYLTEECAGDPDLRRNVEELLAAARASSPLFDKPWIPGEMLARGNELEAEEEPERAIPVGTVLANRFDIVGLVARGGMGAVYEARDRALDIHIALKVIDPGRGLDAAVRDRFRREVNLARRVTHPNVCRIFDLVEDGRLLFLTMELLSGESLAERLLRGPLTEEETLAISEQIGAALEAAHRVGVIHRDLKPGNVMLVPEQAGRVRAVVTDFGLAVAAAPGERDPHPITRTGQVLGTLAYMAPEQLEGHPATSATDIYALGLLVHQMLTGKLPFRADTPISMALERLRAPAPVTVSAPIDRRWKSIIQRCLERNPSDRFASASQFAAALRGEIPIRLSRSSRRKLLITSAAIIAGLAATVALVSLSIPRNAESSRTRQPPAASTKWVLVTAFDNRTGDSVLDGTIDYALERELNDSASVHAVPRERIQDVLLLMKRPASTRIDADIGRDLAVRDGNTHALLSGRIQRLGSSYVIHAELSEPRTGVAIATVSEQAASVEEILPAVRRLAGQLRGKLGEEPAIVRQSQAELDRVTTPSLPALQLFSKADSLVAYRDNAAAAELLKEAIAADPSFASAHMHLAWALRNQGKPASEHLPYARRAFELAETASETERYFIRGSYFQMLGRFDEAIASYKALLQIDPDHFWAINNLEHILGLFTPRYEEAIPYALHRARLQPNNLLANFRAAQALAIWADRPEAALPYVRRGLTLVDEHVTGRPAELQQTAAAWLQFFAMHQAWLRGEIPSVIQELEVRVMDLGSIPSKRHDAVADQIGRGYLAVGKLRAAEAVFETITDPNWREGALLDLALARQDESEIVSRLRRRASVLYRGSTATAIELAHRGLAGEARRILARLPEGVEGVRIVEPEIRAVEGALALHERKPDRGVALLESSVRALRPTGSAVYFLAARSLARAWIMLGDPERARAVLADAFRQKRRTYPRSQRLWIAASYELAQLHRKTGQTTDAEAVEKELAAVLRLADANHPIGVRLLRAAAR
jgi:serine/threonine protein kinase/tetratricopeptide (TPR) repeat protein